MLASFPSAVHEGNGTMQVIVDDKASDAQREAIVKIINGEDTEPMATMWSVYSAMAPNKLETLSKPINIEINIEERVGTISVPGVFETVGEPIRNPVTGDKHRVRIDVPDGFEFEIAEIWSASTEATGDIKLSLKDSYGQFCALHLNNNGVVRGAPCPRALAR